MDLEKLHDLISLESGQLAQAALLAIAFRSLAAQGLIDRERAIADVRKILEPLVGECFTADGKQAAQRTIETAIAVINGEV